MPFNLKTLSEDLLANQSLPCWLALRLRPRSWDLNLVQDDEGKQTLRSFAMALAAMADSDISSSINRTFLRLFQSRVIEFQFEMKALLRSLQAIIFFLYLMSPSVAMSRFLCVRFLIRVVLLRDLHLRSYYVIPINFWNFKTCFGLVCQTFINYDEFLFSAKLQHRSLAIGIECQSG